MARNNDVNEININLSKQRQLNIEYWTKRAEKTYLEGEKEALDIAKQLQSNYKRCIREIENKINLFYGKYASENGMSLEEAKKYLDKNQLKDFKSYIQEMISMGKKENFTEKQLNEFKRLYNKAKITRLEELQTNIKYELDRLTNTNEENIKELLENSYEEGYYKSIYNAEQFKGFSSSFSSLNSEAVTKAVATKYLGSNYSQRIWQNESNLSTTLEQEIPRGLTLGYNPRKLAKLTSDRLSTNYNNTVRLIRTEYGKILNDSTLAGYKQSGIDKYQILSALDMRTCEDCGELDNKIFDVNKGEVGINLPPFHPNCRCTTIPYFEPDEFDKLNETEVNTKTGKKVPLNISYNEWKEGLQGKSEVQYQNATPLVKATSDINEWKNSLTRQEIEALENYSWKEYGDTSVANFEDINNYLRTGEVSKVGKTTIDNAINNIKNAINKYQLDKNITVYRGIDTATLIEQATGEKKFTRDINAINNYLKGKTIENTSFISTSISQKEALNFGMGSGRAIMKINIPEGTKGAYIDQVSRISKEKEFLLDTNTKFKINSIRLDNRLERFVILCDLV